MKTIAIESPVTLRAYAVACWLDSLRRGEHPNVPLAVYRDALKILGPEELELAIESHYASADQASTIAVYTDEGITPNMRTMARKALMQGRSVEFRCLTPGMAADVDVSTVLSEV